MRIEVAFVMVNEFHLDVAMYGISDNQLALAKKHLGRHPLRGKLEPNNAGVRRYEIGKYDIKYLPTKDLREIILLRIVPAQEQPSQLTAKARKLVGELAKSLIEDRVKKLLGKKE